MKKQSTVWIKSGTNWYLSDDTVRESKLENKIYRLEFDERRSELYLEESADSFTFPYKIYGLEREFINRVITTYNKTQGNLGMILNGVKGTGKTVTGEIIASELNNPIIIISKAYEETPAFLNKIEQDITVFIDEFEKIYDSYKYSLLSVMDGVLSSEKRIVFILTSNSLNIDKNLIQRPSRVRYLKTFDDLNLDVIKEVVLDLLENKSFIEDTVLFLSKLPIITIDIVKTIIQEINIHNQLPSSFKDVLNVNDQDNSGGCYVKLYVLDDEGNVVSIRDNVHFSMIPTEDKIGCDLYINRSWVGELKTISDDIIVLDKDDKLRRYKFELKDTHKAFRNVSVSSVFM